MTIVPERIEEYAVSHTTKTMAAFNARVANDDRVTQVMLTVRDGVFLIRKV